MGADKKSGKLSPNMGGGGGRVPPQPPNICILRSQRICIDLRNDGFGPEKAEIHRSAEKSYPSELQANMLGPRVYMRMITL